MAANIEPLLRLGKARTIRVPAPEMRVWLNFDHHRFPKDAELSFAQDISAIREIHSHPQAFAQCRANLDKLQAEAGNPIRLAKTESTSEGVIIAQRDPTKAAIGSFEAAKFYGVPIGRVRRSDRCIDMYLLRRLP